MKKPVSSYRSRKTVEAYEFKDGMEDGFQTRYYDPNNLGPDGLMHAWGFGGPDDSASIEVPYVKCPKTGRSVLAGKGYMMVMEDRGLTAVDMADFNAEYEPL